MPTPLGPPPGRDDEKLEPIVLVVAVLVIIGYVVALSLPPIG